MLPLIAGDAEWTKILISGHELNKFENCHTQIYIFVYFVYKYHISTLITNDTITRPRWIPVPMKTVF